MKLSERVERAEGADRALDCEVFIATTYPDWRIQTNCDLFPEQVQPGRIQEPDGCGWRNSPAYTASIDAVMGQVPEGWTWAIGFNGHDSGHPAGTASLFEAGGAMFKGAAATPALALLAAALKARGL